MTEPNNRQSHRILIVDDEKAIRMMLLDYLENKYEIETAETGEEALELLEEQKFDLVISDINNSFMLIFEFFTK